MHSVSLVVLDMAGTTVHDDGTVEEAFARVHEETGLTSAWGDVEAVRAFARETMGQSKIDVFRELTANESDAEAATGAFEAAYERLLEETSVAAIAGAEEAIRTLRGEGIEVVFTTGFSRSTVNALLDRLSWQGLASLVLTPADAGRGRPWPDLNLTAVIRTQGESVARMAVVGDTSSDMLSAVRAGAGRAIGVETGAHSREQLLEAGATDIIPSVADLTTLLGIGDKDHK